MSQLNLRDTLVASRASSTDNFISGRYRTLKMSSASGLTVRKTKYLAGPLPAHTHVHARFVFVVAGEFTEECDGLRRECSEGMILFRPPAEPHSEQFGPRPATSISVDVAPHWMSRLRRHGLALRRSVSLRSEAAARLSARLDYEMAIHDAAASIAIEAILLEAAVEASRSAEPVDATLGPSWLTHVVEFLRAELSRSVSLVEVGRAAGVHPAHLARVFRRTHGCSIGEYVRRLRVQAVRSALDQSDAPLSHIAASTGFADQSHLCRTFKRLVGVTPGRYRTLARRR